MTVPRIIAAGVVTGVLAAALSLPTARAQQNSSAAKSVTSSSMTKETEQVHNEGVHHYSNPAEEAEDAALITKVKTALAIDGVANGHPVEVDCDHGVARLSGVVDSADDAKHAAQVVANVPGVAGVDNKLSWK